MNNIKKRNSDTNANGIYDSPFVVDSASIFVRHRGSGDFLPTSVEAKLIGKGFCSAETFPPFFFASAVPFSVLLFHFCTSEMIIRRYLFWRRSQHGCAQSTFLTFPLPPLCYHYHLHLLPSPFQLCTQLPYTPTSVTSLIKERVSRVNAIRGGRRPSKIWMEIQLLMSSAYQTDRWLSSTVSRSVLPIQCHFGI